MQIGILASSLHAINTGTMFSVYYRPRTSSSEFIVPYHRYMDSANHNYSVGMRFRMTFEGEDGEGERHTGTIIGIEDADPMEWPDSKWKCFKAQWDQPSTIPRPDRVCPWDITPFDAAVEPSKLSGAKRHRPCRTSLPPKSFAPPRNGSLKICKEPSPKIQGFFHGQDKIAGVNFISDQDDNADNHLASQQKLLKIRREILVDQIQNRSSNSDHKKSNKYLNTSLTTGSRTPGNPYLDRYMSIRSVTENCCKVPKLFGIPLIQNSSHGVVPHLATLNELLEHSKTSNHAAHSPSYMLDCDQFSEQSNSSKLSEFSGSGTLNDQSYANHPIPSRSCTKEILFYG